MNILVVFALYKCTCIFILYYHIYDITTVKIDYSSFWCKMTLSFNKNEINLSQTTGS